MEKTEKPLIGIGGWLILLAIGIVLSPFIMLAGLISLLDALEYVQRSSGLNIIWRTLIVAETGFLGIFFAWSCLNVWLFFGRKALFPRSYLWLIWTAFVYTVVDMIAVSNLPGMNPSEEDIRQIVIQLFWAVIWSGYILKSRRVANTFNDGTVTLVQWVVSGKGFAATMALPFLATLVFVVYQNSAPLTPRDIANSAKSAFVTVTGYYNEEPHSSGSGFVVRPDGIIVTNLHVLQGSDQIELTLSSGEVHSRVHVLGVDSHRDLVLLQIQAAPLQSLLLHQGRSLEVGDKVFVLGNPLGLEQTFSDGILSARRIDDGTEYLQITAPISEGSSGGPVLSSRGEVIGVATAFNQDGQNLSWAVPARYVSDLLQSAGEPELFTEIAMRPEFDEGETVAKRTRESASLFEKLPASLRSVLADLDPWAMQTMVRSLHFESLLEENGWVKVGDSFGLELLEQEHIADAYLDVEAGEYAIVAVCDDDCLDLDLGVEIHGQDMLIDREPDANPMVFFDVDEGLGVTIYTRMHECETVDCFYMVDIYRRR